jgi:hypothetical protein
MEMNGKLHAAAVLPLTPEKSLRYPLGRRLCGSPSRSELYGVEFNNFYVYCSALSIMSRLVIFDLGYAKTSYGVCKIVEKCYFVINTEKSGSDLGLATGDPDLRSFDLGAPFLSLSLSPPPGFLDVDYRLCIT